MTFYGNNDWRDYLAHYGVKGMKWDEHKYTGVVNGEYVYGNNPVTKQATTALISKAKHVVSAIKKANKSSGRNKIVGNRKGPFYDPIYESDVKKDKNKNEKSEKSADYDKNLESLAKDVANGKYGAGDDRKKKLESMGVSYAVVQNKVNELLGSSKRHKVTLDDETRTSAAFTSGKVAATKALSRLASSSSSSRSGSARSTSSSSNSSSGSSKKSSTSGSTSSAPKKTTSFPNRPISRRKRVSTGTGVTRRYQTPSRVIKPLVRDRFGQLR